jgi:KEOPS complex subunit Cgi121
VRAFFDVTDRELAATDGDLADLVHERVALLDVRK